MSKNDHDRVSRAFLRCVLVGHVAAMGLLLSCETEPEIIPCNYQRDCPPDMSCQDGICAPRVDAGQVDAGQPDGSATDARSADAATTDTWTTDSQTTDAQMTDAPMTDTQLPDSAEADAASLRLDAEEICALRLSWMEHSDLCRDANPGSALDYSSDWLELACRPGTGARLWADELLAAEAEGRVEIDWGQAQSCLDSARDLRSGASAGSLLELQAWDDLKRGACHAFYRGLRATDEPCEQSWDCAEGLGCYSDDPFVADSLRCRPPAGLGDPCLEEFYACAEGLYCDSSNSCVSKRAPGASCSSDVACLSGACSSERCEPIPAAIGSSCSPGDTCAGECTVCRRLSDISAYTCEHRAGRGEYCLDDDHCLKDLDCIGDACGSRSAGSSCGYRTGRHCDPDLSCVPEVDCDAIGSAGACTSASPTCYWDSDFGCRTNQGTCASLPVSGPCLHGRYCAQGSCCSASSPTCMPCAQLGESCSDYTGDLAPCAPGLRCEDTRCTLICAVREDCADTEYCDTSTGECMYNQPGACSSDAQCEREQYCSSGGVCRAKKQAGESCSDDEECLSSICYQYLSDPSRCTVRSGSGCNGREDPYLPEILRAVFLLGGVFFMAGRRRSERPGSTSGTRRRSSIT